MRGLTLLLGAFFSLLAMANDFPSSVISAPPTLRALEKKGLSFGALLCERAASTTAALKPCSRYEALVKTLTADTDERIAFVEKMLPDARVDSFDPRWLLSEKTSLRLIGVVERLDRQPFLDGKCGEIRLIYRLAASYREDKKDYSTFLPLTAMLVAELSGNCRDLAKERLAGSEDLETLTLREISRASLRLEVNFLALRVDSPVLPASAGYAEYVMRIFGVGKTLAPQPLENTPDTNRLSKDKKAREELLAWLFHPDREKSIEAGTLRVPEKFLATRAISVSPFGALRLANAPFSSILRRDRLPKEKASQILRRLNMMSCQGCHQTQSDAGFHFLGESLSDSLAQNRTELPFSRHFLSENAWRSAALKQFAEKGSWPDRPVPGRTWNSHGEIGDVCNSDLPCAKGVSCRHLWEEKERAELSIGYCQKEKAPLPGEPCLLGAWEQKGGLHDALGDISTTDCFAHAQCLPHSIGFPGGLCVTPCDGMLPGTGCHKVPALQKFTECRAKGRSLAVCFRDASESVALRKCGIDSPCRPDYVCASGEHGKGSWVTRGQSKSDGACVPPYFLPQLNVRDHRL